MKIRQFGGLAILLTVAIIIASSQFYSGRGGDDPDSPSTDAPAEAITIEGIGGGKKTFFEDAEVIRILKDRYGLTVNVTGNIGSVAMIQRCTVAEGWDFCIPQSQPIAETIKTNLGSNLVASEIIFNSPLVIYTWAPIVEALIEQNLVQQIGGVYYLVDLPKLVQMVKDGTQWTDIGLPQLYGDISILSSDPTTSSSGNTWAVLLGSVLNGGDVVDETTVEQISPQLKPFFNRLLAGTSTVLLAQFIAMGMGASPLCVLYESHVLEYSLVNPDLEHQKYIKDNIRTLYPTPTIWSTQYAIGMTEGGKRLVNALRDAEIQGIGWSKHGYRPSVPSVLIDPSTMGVPGLPVTIDSVISMPKPPVVDRIIEILSAAAAPVTPTPGSQASPTAVAFRNEMRDRPGGQWTG